MIIQHNLAAQNVMTQFGITNDNLKKATERLSSGYKINRAADNPAALAISEKKRAQIRGLNRAAKNAEDGISFVQTGDGAMSQTGALLHRMRELAVQALNDGVLQRDDQAALQMEFDQLQSEIDRVNDQTEFNKKMVFEHYADNYSVIEGNRVWSQNQLHNIDSSNSSLTVKYITVAEDGTETEKETTLTIPEGRYTTQELMDEMDDVVTALGEGADGLYLEYTDGHTCNMVLQDGKEIKDVSGGLSYLFFDSFGGNTSGALIGTTIFYPGNPLMVKTGKNDELHFRIEFFDGTSKDIDITVAEDGYTQTDMIKYLNEYTLADGKKLKDYGMEAKPYGSASIQIGGDTGLITGLKGNMFEIDTEHYDSVFYDNVKYGSVTEVPAIFTGADVLNRQDLYHSKFNITSGVNDTLKIRVDGGNWEEIKLDAGSYDIEGLNGMVEELQKKLDAKNLGITVSSHNVSGVKAPNGNIHTFYGLTLTGSTIGKGGKIEFDVPNSSAYETLFVKRKYTDIGVSHTSVSGLWSYSGSAHVTGGRIFDAVSDFPITFSKDKNNNSFTLDVTEQGKPAQKKTIELNGTYGDMTDLIKAVQEQIDNAGYKGKIEVSSYGSRIRLSAAPGNETVAKVNVAKNSTDGYNVLFVGETISWPAVTETTLQPIKPGADGKIVFTDTNNRLTVDVGAETRTVIVPPGSYTPEKLEEILNGPDSALKGKDNEGENSHLSNSIGGSTVSVYTPQPAKDEPFKNTTVPGTGGKGDGSTQVKDGTAATHTLGGTLPATTVITAGVNDKFSINVNGKTYDITLDKKNGGYSQSALAAHLQDKINAAASGANQVRVTVSSGHLKFETVSKGKDMSITTDGYSSTFLTSINTNKTKAYITTGSLPSNLFPFTLGSTNNKFTIKIDGKDTSVTLPSNPAGKTAYESITDIKNELNTLLTPKGVTVSAYGSGLKFERATAGSGSVSLDSNNSGTAGAFLFKTPATSTMSPITIPKKVGTKDGTVKYSVTLGGKTYTATLTNTSTTDTKTYTAAQLKTALDGAVWKLNDTGAAQKPSDLGFTTSVVGSQIRFTTTARGSGQTIRAGAKSGPIITTTPTIEAVVKKNSDGTISVGLKSKSYFTPRPYNKAAVLQPKGSTSTVAPPTTNTRNFTTRKYKLTTRRPISLPASVNITEENKNLNFTYRYHDGTEREIKIELDAGRSYTRAQLQQALQAKLDAAIEGDAVPPRPGEGPKVTVGNQITLESKSDGRYNIINLNGGFYEQVMKGTETRSKNERAINSDGHLVVDDVYIAGRKDIRNKSTRIEKGENDELTMDITINGNVTTLQMTLDPGTYSSDSLVKHIQKKLAEQLKANNLPENMVLAGVGVFDSGVEGTDDKNSLFFYLNKKLELDPGTYGIDHLGGKALFSIFYKTDGDPIPAYIAGTKDISDGAEVKAGENKFSVEVDGKPYDFEIKPGVYKTAEALADAVDAALKEVPDSCLKAGLSGNSLKISYTKLGEHKIGNIQGPMKMSVFYKSTGRYDEEVDEWLQIGANDGQGVELKRFSVSTLSMGINSIAISQPKYANKALNRIDDALKYLSSRRSLYGALENRLEYAVKVDEITAENTQSSESLDRDADMASEMVQYAKANILQQVGLSILSQANQSTQSVLSLLG